MKGTYIGYGKMLVTPVWGGKLILPSDDLSLTPDLTIGGAMEPPLTQYFINNVKSGNVVVDIGANVGYFTVLLGYLIGAEGKLYAYEANPFIYNFLMDNLSINYLHDRTKAYNQAVYSKETTISFFASKRFMGNSSIHQFDSEYFKHYVDEIQEITVNAVSLDEQLSSVENIDFLKIDIEGGEFNAYMGMEKLLKNNIIKTVVFELNKGMLQNDWQPFVNLLTAMNQKGRNFYRLSNEGNLIPTSIDELVKSGSNPYVVMQ